MTTDAGQAWEANREFLAGDPVRNNVVCTLLAQMSQSGAPIRCWYLPERGVVFHSSDAFPAVLSTMSSDVAGQLASRVATDGVPGAAGLPNEAAAFAGAYATATRRGASPTEGQRIYEARDVTPPAGIDGRMRAAREQDIALLADWIVGFTRDTGDGADTDATTRARAIVGAGRYWIWETSNGDPVSSALTAPSTLGVVRIGGVYTPPDLRRHGYAAAVVAALTARILADTERAILYTQLQNPTSNGVYQRIGYSVVAEVVRYSFA